MSDILAEIIDFQKHFYKRYFAVKNQYFYEGYPPQGLSEARRGRMVFNKFPVIDPKSRSGTSLRNAAIIIQKKSRQGIKWIHPSRKPPPLGE